MINTKEHPLIVGSGSGISKFLSKKFQTENIPSNSLKDVDLSKYKHIIYTSTDPASYLPEQNISEYLEKNIFNIYKIIQSNFRGCFSFISSIDSGPYDIQREGIEYQNEKMFTPYSFSKYSSELLILSCNIFERCNILRIGLLWPPKTKNNFYKALNSPLSDIKLNLDSSFFITPYSLVSRFFDKYKNEKETLSYGYLTSSNKIFLSDLLKLRDMDLSLIKKDLYTYRSRDKDTNIKNLLNGNWYDWSKEEDFNPLIAKCLKLHKKEEILP